MRKFDGLNGKYQDIPDTALALVSMTPRVSGYELMDLKRGYDELTMTELATVLYSRDPQGVLKKYDTIRNQSPKIDPEAAIVLAMSDENNLEGKFRNVDSRYITSSSNRALVAISDEPLQAVDMYRSFTRVNPALDESAGVLLSLAEDPFAAHDFYRIIQSSSGVIQNEYASNQGQRAVRPGPPSILPIVFVLAVGWWFMNNQKFP